MAAIAAPSAGAKAGALDRTFGEGGRAATALDLGSSWKDAPIRLAAAPDGGTVVASGRQIFRYLGSGQLDRAFGAGGSVTLDSIEGLSFTFTDVAVDSEGRIVAFGSAIDPSTTIHAPFYPAGGFVQPTYAVVVRFDATGKLDPGFGGGDGVLRTDFGLRPIPLVESGGPPAPPLARTVAGTVDAAGRPVLLAALEEVLPCEFHCAYLSWSARLVARLTAAGEIDKSFGTGGFSVLSTRENQGLLVDSESESVLAWGGLGTVDSQLKTEVTRLRADGTADANYGTDGLRTIRGGGGAIALDRSGRLLVLDGPRQNRSGLLRLLPNGDFDRSFGRGGRRAVTLPGQGSVINALVVDSSGRPVLIGTSEPTEHKPAPAASRRVLVGRLQTSGSTDGRFGHRGWVQTGFGRQTKIGTAREALVPNQRIIVGPQAVLDPRGRLVVADTARSPQLQPGGIVLARYRMN